VDGGISALCGLIAHHRGALEYDWRTRFGLPLAAIGTEAMTITEAARLASQLVNDPGSATAASVIGWNHPLDWSGIVLADLFDLVHRALSEGTVEPHWVRPAAPRPVRVIDQDAVDAALRLTGHAA
jgi:hypothetical protein